MFWQIFLQTLSMIGSIMLIGYVIYRCLHTMKDK